MTNPRVVFRKISAFFIIFISACTLLPSNERTPYTVIEPAEIYYYDQSDAIRKSDGEHTATGPIISNQINPIVTKKVVPITARRVPFSQPTNSTKVTVEYRKIAAEHIYKLNRDRIYKGVLPPFLQAIGVVKIRLDRDGRILDLQWLRKPNHAPELVTQMEALLYNAAPYPSKPNQYDFMFTETWLWHESGKFQLLSLTEGQANGEPEKLTR